MSATTLQVNWGNWSLGDLVDTARRVTELVGHSAVVESITVDKPNAEGVPEVLLAVADETEVAELREAVEHSEYVAEFYGSRAPWLWHAEVAGLKLVVETEGVLP